MAKCSSTCNIWIIRRPPARANLSRSYRDSHDCSGHAFLGPVKNITSLPKGVKSYTVKIGEKMLKFAYSETTSVRRAREYRGRDFWGLIDGIAVKTQQYW
jgi:hypothetical protein